MTINIFVLKGDLNGEIVVVRFFFCRVYIKITTNCILLNGSYLCFVENDAIKFEYSFLGKILKHISHFVLKRHDANFHKKKMKKYSWQSPKKQVRIRYLLIADCEQRTFTARIHNHCSHGRCSFWRETRQLG